MPSTFNGSIWHALCVLLPLGIVIFLTSFFSLRKNHYYFFDPKHNVDPRLKAEGGDYEPHAKRYQELARLAITLSAAAIAFLVSFMATDKPVAPAFAHRIQTVAPIVSGFFGSCIALLVFFMVLQAIWYEAYCHSPDHSSYQR